MKKTSLLVCALVLLAACLLILPTRAEAAVIDSGNHSRYPHYCR